MGEIKQAEKNDKEGNKIYSELTTEYLEKYMPKPDANPHGGPEDFKEVENPNHHSTDILENALPRSKDNLNYH